MRILTSILLIIILTYVLLKKRKIDYFLIFSLSLLLYYFPIFIGYLKVESGFVNISNTTYLCIFVIEIILLIFMMLYDKFYLKKVFNQKNESPVSENKTKIENNEISNFSILILSIIGFILMIISYFHYGNIFSGSFNKANLLMSTSKSIEYLKYISLFVFSYSFIFEGKFIKLCRINSIILIVYTFFLGHRSFIVIGLITIFMHRIGSFEHKRLIDYIRKNKKIFIFIFLFATFFLFVKNIFAAFMAGNYQLVLSRLSNPNYYIDTLLESEGNTIMLNLNNVIVSNFEYGFDDYIFGLFSLVPILGSGIISMGNYETFSQKLGYAFNSRIDEGIGLGSTYLGESYAVGGIFFLIIMFFLTLFFIKWLSTTRNKFYIKKNQFLYTYVSIILTYFTFYIHRNSLLFLLIMARAYLYILILLFLIYSILKMRVAKKVGFNNEK